MYQLPGSYLDQLLEAEDADWRTERDARQPSRKAKQEFRSSLAWRRVRYAVLAESAARNGGTARCELCGRAGMPEAPLHVDHVEAVSKNWSRRFDRTNLQVMCA